MPSNNASRRNQASKQSETSRVPAWVWLFTGAVLGAFIMFLMRLSDVQPSKSDASTTAPKQQTREKQTPRFDFYDLLKEDKVPVPVTSKPQNASSPKQAAQEFILQVASFKSLEDAEQLRAELILLNLEAYTERAKIRNGETWHRVLVGPFVSKSKLAKARSILLGNRHEALVLKRNVAN